MSQLYKIAVIMNGVFIVILIWFWIDEWVTEPPVNQVTVTLPLCPGCPW